MTGRRVPADPVVAAVLGAVVGGATALLLAGRGPALVVGAIDVAAAAALAGGAVSRSRGAYRWRRLVDPRVRPDGSPLAQRLDAVLAFAGVDGAAVIVDEGGPRLEVAARVGTLASKLGESVVATNLGPAWDEPLHIVARAALPPGSPLAATAGDIATARMGGSTLLVTSRRIDRTNVRRLAQLRAIAQGELERARLDDAERRSRLGAAHARRHLALLAAASAALSRALEDWTPALEDLLAEIVPMHADYAAVDLVIETGDVQRVAAMHIDPALIGASHDPAAVEPAWAAGIAQVVRRGRAQLFPEVAAARSGAPQPSPDERIVRLHRALRLDSWAVVPIRTRGLTVGALTIGTNEPRRGLRPSDVAAYEELAARTAVSIERVLLYRETQEAARVAGANAGRLGRVVEASPALAGGLTLDEVVRTAAREVLRTMGGRQAAVSVYPPDRPPVLAGWPVSAPTGRPAADIAALGDTARTGGQPVRGEGRLSWIAAPIAVPGSRTTGSMVLVAPTGHSFSPEEESVMVLLAQVTAAAVRHAELYEALASSERRLRALIDAAPLAILEIQPDGELLASNAAAATLLRSDPPVLHPRALETIERLRGRLAGGERIVDERTTLERVDGTSVEVSIAAALVHERGHLLCLVSDVTERVLLEREIQQTRRMEALGRLAGGVAHDFNNLLTVIVGYSDLLARTLGPDHPNFPDVDAIRVAGERAKTFTEQLLTISRRKVVKAAPVDLGSAVQDMEPVLRRLIGEDVALECTVDPSPAFVVIDPGQLEQVLLNLAVNARHAMPEGGRLSIAATRDDGDQPAAVLTVADTGVGMDASVLERCFEPFFTTRERGQGSGLGLATVYGIVEQAHGRITVASAVGAGTSFRISFPAAAPPTEQPGEATPDEVGTAHRGDLLLIEDDTDVRAFARTVLADAGFDVQVAANAEEAIGLVDRPELLEHIDIVVTDVVMPGMSGRELAAELTSRRPDLPVLFMSGYVDERAARTMPEPRVSTFLPKPFNAQELLGAVRQLLGRVRR